MLSRIADSLFWLSRYMERSDSLMRVVRTNYILSFDTGTHSDFSWRDVLSLVSHANEEAIAKHSSEEGAALSYLIADSTNLNSMKVLVTKARENARGVQDNITKEVWEQVNQLYHIVNQPKFVDQITGSRTLETIDILDQNNILFYGVTDSTMPRGLGWNFMNLGKFIERCILTIDTTYAHFRKIDHQVSHAQDILFWKNLLLSLSGYELYLKTYTRGKHNMNVIDQIIFNKDFPRSLFYCLDRIKRYLEAVSEDTQMEGTAGLQRTLGRIVSKVEFADMSQIEEVTLAHFLYSLRSDLIDFSNQLTRIYFSYA